MAAFVTVYSPWYQYITIQRDTLRIWDAMPVPVHVDDMGCMINGVCGMRKNTLKIYIIN